MLIGVDGRAANLTTRVGVHVYCEEVLRAMAARTPRVPLRIYLDAPPRDGFPVAPDAAEFRILPPCKLWTGRRLARELRRDPPDAVLVPTMQFPRGCPCPTVAPVHETAFKRMEFEELKGGPYRPKNLIAYRDRSGR